MPRNRSHSRRAARSNPRGVLRVHPSGYGFVLTAEGEFFVPNKFMKGAFDGDLVEVVSYKADRDAKTDGRADTPAPAHKQAKVVQVLNRAHEQVVGRVEVVEPFAVVIPADPHLTHDIFTLRKDAPDVPDGAIVRVTMVTYPDRNSAATGVIDEVIALDSSAAAMDMIMARYHFDRPFTAEALAEAAAATIDVSAALSAGYRDLRDRTIFTIDPADAKDFDDAVSFALLPNGSRRVGVHIADVSAYVPWGSAVDADAKQRATSVYPVHCVVPMIPEALSDGLCSLVPQEDRLTMTVDIILDNKGEMKSFDVYPAVIRSAARLTYAQAQEVIEGARGAFSPEVEKALVALDTVAEQRLILGDGRGCLDFDGTEAKVRLAEDGTPVAVDLRVKTRATSLIEECMIMANVAVAQFLVERNHPGAFRVHECPDADALAALVPVFSRFGWWRAVDEELFVMGQALQLRKALQYARVNGNGEVVGNLLLRAMKRAAYKPACDGHYGLALEHYCHFTSPIRRYPDLMVHRMVKQLLGFSQPEFGAQVAALPALCDHSSQMERMAEEAARETQVYKLIEFLAPHVGETFTVTISGLTARNLYLRLENTAEGTMDYTDLGREYFSYDPVHQCAIGDSSGLEYHIGDVLEATLVEADPHLRILRFKPKRKKTE